MSSPRAQAETALRALGRTPSAVCRAPGRVNLIGEHVDYLGGFVCPMAIDRETVVAAAPREDRTLRVRSVERDETVEIALDGPAETRDRWSDYVEGVARSLRAAGIAVGGADLAIATTVPIGAGLSSSAALELAAGGALCALAGAPAEPRALAAAARRAENDFVGVASGIMDQLVGALGRRGHALLIDCRSEATTLVPLPADAAIVVADSGVRHQLSGSGYNTRRSESEAAAARLGVALRDADEATIAAAALPPPLDRRARHVVTENARVLRFVAALNDGDLAAAGAEMLASHRSLRDDYEVSVPELDALVAAAVRVEGVYGARMTGGGFGGSIVALVARSNVRALLAALDGIAAGAMEVESANGVSLAA